MSDHALIAAIRAALLSVPVKINRDGTAGRDREKVRAAVFKALMDFKKAAQLSPRTEASSGTTALPESERHTNQTKTLLGGSGGVAGEPRGGE